MGYTSTRKWFSNGCWSQDVQVISCISRIRGNDVHWSCKFNEVFKSQLLHNAWHLPSASCNVWHSSWRRHKSCILEEDKVKINLTGVDLHFKGDGFVRLFVPTTFGVVLRLKVILYWEKYCFCPILPTFFHLCHIPSYLETTLFIHRWQLQELIRWRPPPPYLGWEESTKLFSQSQLRQAREKQSKLYRKLESALRK